MLRSLGYKQVRGLHSTAAALASALHAAVLTACQPPAAAVRLLTRRNSSARSPASKTLRFPSRVSDAQQCGQPWPCLPPIRGHACPPPGRHHANPTQPTRPRPHASPTARGTLAVVSVLTGLTGLYGLGMTYGGPVAVVWGWPLVSLFTLCVALSMAEICSAFPTSGALYFWAAKLAGTRWAPLASWVRRRGGSGRND